MGAQRARAIKFCDGYLISTGEPKNHYIDEGARHVWMRQGVLGITAKVISAHDPEIKMGPKMPMPGAVILHEPKGGLPVMQPGGGNTGYGGAGGYGGGGGGSGSGDTWWLRGGAEASRPASVVVSCRCA